MPQTACNILHSITAFALIAASFIPAIAQSAPANPNDPPAIAFEVVSVRRNPADMSPQTARFDFPANGDSLTLTDILLSSIVGSFYGYDQPSQSGMPDWANSDCYDIHAKVAPSDLAAYHQLTRQQRNRMVQVLLEDRFHLRTHIEQREAPIYSLVVAKSGLKIKPATPGITYTDGPRDANGQPVTGTLFVGPNGEQIARAITLSFFADSLKSMAGRTVVDHTSLPGTYDFTFRWSPSPDPDTPSLFTALEEQLGLKLTPARGPIKILIIDHIERPDGN